MTTAPAPAPAPALGNSGTGAAPLLAPELIGLPGVPGGQSDVLSQVFRAGLDPVVAFGAAGGLHRIVGNDAANSTLQRFANPTQTPTAAGASPQPAASTQPAGPAPEAAQPPQSEPQTSLDGSASSPMDGATAEMPKAPAEPSPPAAAGTEPAAGPDAGPAQTPKPAATVGEEPVKEARGAIGKAFSENGVKAAVREGTVLAARRGAGLGAKIGARALLRAGLISVPVLGEAINVALWVLDTEGRKDFNNLIAATIGGGSAAPDVDAPPVPPRTYFLPLTHDGNRDGVITKKDHGMSGLNDTTFRFNPDDVWPTMDPPIETTTNFAAAATKVNTLNTQLTEALEALTAIYQSHADEPYVVQSWASTKPGVEALTDFQSTMLPTIGAQLMAGAKSTNDAYQAFREVNLKNRQEINNSTSGLIPFWANHVNEANMSDSKAEMKDALTKVDEAARTLATAVDGLAVKTNRVGTPPTGPAAPTLDDATQPAPAPAPAPSVEPAAGSGGGLNTGAGQGGDNQGKDLASLLRGAMPGGGMGMPSMPQIPSPGGGGIPQIPQIPGLGEGGARPLGDTPADQDALKKALDDKFKDKDTTAAKALADQPADSAATAAGPPAAASSVSRPATAAAQPPQGPAASNTTEIGGRKWTFDNPKSAALAHNLTGTDGAGHKSLQQAASDAGFKLPPPGQDIGTPVGSPDQLKPGDVIMGADNHNGVFLGVIDGQAMAVDESGQTAPLDKIAQFDGPHQGLFRLADDGAPLPATTQVQSVDTTSSPPPPATTLASAPTDPGIVPGQSTGIPGLNPGTAPTNS